MSIFPLKQNSSYIKAYFAALAQFQQHGHVTEGNTRSAFADLLKRGCGPYGWHLVEEFNFKGTKKQPLRADGALIDGLTLNHGIWEAKDTADDLKKEIRAKVEKGYPLTNTLFQSPDHAVLYQDSRIAFDGPITTAAALVEVLEAFFGHQIVPGVDWQKVIKDFGEQIPSIAGGMDKLLNAEHESNAVFRERFAAFAELCRTSINPDLSDESIRKMLVQHLLTERIFRKVFNNQEFLQRNVIAVEIEKVIRSITDKHFSRDQFLRNLDHFYIPLEKAAEQQEDYTEKQHFLNAVYERFFQSFDPKQADTMGIVYTPQPIVDFMVRSVEEILKQEFGKSLSDEGVHILDPFTGTGNFITRIMQEIKRSALPHKYAHELHCNEIMLLPYYIASMNIEHAYMEKVGSYSSFEGICLVDTFELAEQKQKLLFSEENNLRVSRQKAATIKVIIGNPPYRGNQKNEDEQNKNRSYKALDGRISDTYSRDSKASSKNKLRDPFIRALRWATDRIGDEGVVAYVINGGFVDREDSDGVRKHLLADYTSLYVLDLGGNTRRHPHLSGTTHNVFGIKLSVAIVLLVKKAAAESAKHIKHGELEVNLKRQVRLAHLTGSRGIISETPNVVSPNEVHAWISDEEPSGFSEHLAMGVKGKHVNGATTKKVIFSRVSLGLNSNRDPWVFNYSETSLLSNVSKTARAFNAALDKLPSKTTKLQQLANLASREDEISWSEGLKLTLLRRKHLRVGEGLIRRALYRPFTRQFLYFDRDFLERRYALPIILPTEKTENTLLVVKLGKEVPVFTYAAKEIPSGLTQGGSLVFAYFTYEKDGTNRRENITDWALNEFRKHYSNDIITKWNIFHATYAILHHPEYRTRYAANLKRELPRIPFPPDFHAFAAAGQRLMELHIDYEQQPEYKLEQIEDPKADISFRVQKMKLSKDKTELRYNDFLLLRGIPAGVYDYRLGNRSALEWVIDQYQVSTDKRSGIVNDPNREDDPKYILRLIGQVITVSLETNALVASLPTLGLPDTEQQPVVSQAEAVDPPADSE